MFFDVSVFRRVDQPQGVSLDCSKTLGLTGGSQGFLDEGFVPISATKWRQHIASNVSPMALNL
jgi:hypothetical protein